MGADYDSKAATGALYGTNIGYLEDQEKAAGAAGPGWREFFGNGMAAGPRPRPLPAAAAAPAAGYDAGRQLAVARLVDAYRLLGNRAALIDPLHIEERPRHPSLEMAMHGLEEADLDRSFTTDIPGLEAAPLRDIVAALRQMYCGQISAEFMHITSPAIRRWFIERYEGVRARPPLSKEEKLYVLERMVAADALENYLNRRYTGQKRFSLEGGDALIPLLDVLLRGACADGVKEAMIGMAHRGRLNVLINILGKNPHELFDEFEGKAHRDEAGSGDVKYHMGYSSNLEHAGNTMHMALAFNPSHLEIVNPVVEGSVWARQQRRGDADGASVLPVLVHGDAALAGQGIGMEVLNMSQTRGYGTGGTVHVTVNNQVGFTISHIKDARSTYWCTDLAKMAECPVLHVNGNDPEAAHFAAKLALDFRKEFGQDVFIDLVCYRRHGHNEQDEPKVTQPYMYGRISKMANPASHYAQQLVEEGVIGAGDEEKARKDYEGKLERFETANPLATEGSVSEFIDWSKYKPEKNDWKAKCRTEIDAKRFKRLGGILSEVPEGFTLHPRVAKVVEARAAMAAGDADLDWGMAENLAYASLLEEGFGVRLSGQDVGRGTFFHRHAVWHDQHRSGRDGHVHIPLERAAAGKAPVRVVDSLLSEAAVLGFEYGVSLTSPDMLVVWEAQFGDFANNAQVVIDQFITSGEYKWGRLSGLVMLLPHGYEGQGPEHSSARLERYMQLCAEYNIFVCVPTTAAQIFHLLRRQMVNNLRRPLVVMTPKSLLRNKEVACPKEQFTSGAFQPVIGETDEDIAPKKVRKLVVCSGKVYYELRAARRDKKINDIAIARLEQVYPFPHDAFEAIVASYPNCKQVLWCQEEPGNQGAWHRIQHYLRRHLRGQELRYSLRKSSASTATGHGAEHKAQQLEIIEVALK
ncbi:MAG: 2-oxoglutarate dehydrogenase E1 component [Betaproteobacteria bacterium AqS2]|uniref:oxoglutarate dehydrogenase (succinyl-transferring) n=1 Tax=Candidatus Amphirhobacter heronislandensis TaxID=1732024 RepID=A0A930UCA7_9GAMM|nr:2-oxoglutarate dehydrogenase E1 component [Betaproteobacteria bacterium AqS2]